MIVAGARSDCREGSEYLSRGLIIISTSARNDYHEPSQQCFWCGMKKYFHSFSGLLGISVIFATLTELITMEIKFDKEYLRQLYEEGKTTDKKHRFQPHIVAKYRKTVDLVESLDCVEDLYRYHSLHYGVLTGDKAGLESVRVNDQYRIEMKTTRLSSETVVTVCNIIELSNHY